MYAFCNAHLQICFFVVRMTNVDQKTDLSQLSISWHQRLREIRLAMADTKSARQASQPEQIAQNPSDNELFVGPVYRQVDAEQVFVENVIPPRAAEPKVNKSAFNSVAAIPLTCFPEYRRFSILQVSLLTAIVLIVCILIYELMPLMIPTLNTSVPILQKPLPEVVIEQVEESVPEISNHQESVHYQEPVSVSQPTAVSLKEARQAYIGRNYLLAMEIYQKLLQNLSVMPGQDPMKDFCTLQIALCQMRAGKYDQAAAEFRKILSSSSPAIRVTASYHCGLLEMHKNEYLNARQKAYQAIALIDAIEFDKNWAYSLKKDCFFLAAHALTREILTLTDVDKNQPDELWPFYDAADGIFTAIDESQIIDFLNSGASCLTKALVAPEISVENQGGGNVYNITCSGSSLDELIAKFSLTAKIDTRWNFDFNASSLRKQLIYLHLLSSQGRQFAVIAAGCAGLIARMDDNGLMNFYNPLSYSVLSDHLAVLCSQAVEQWREFILRFPEDNRIANVHFALGLLYAPQNLYTESISEYKLVANRFARSPLAPYALFNLGNIKNSLKDYQGAYEDLRQLMEQFPDSQVAINASLYYAETAGKANFSEESARLYRKVYSLALSPQSQAAAAFGAGKNAFMIQDYNNAEKWLTRYTQMAANTPGKDLYLAYLYLARTYLAQKKTDLACTTIRYALAGVPAYLSKEDYIDIIPTLVESYMKQDSYVQAYSLLESIDTPSLTSAEAVGILVLKSRVLRAMGLVDKALTIFGDRIEFIYDNNLKAQIYFELSQSYIDKGDYNSAHKLLNDVLVLAGPGDLLQRAHLKLADTCLRLGNSGQAVNVCRQLLALQPYEEIKKQALQLLAAAYKQNQNYDSAALALLGQWQ